MFGYVMINKPELKVKEYNRYHGYYCGLCRELKQKYGITGQITLNYDMVFMAALLTGLYEGDEKVTEKRCFIHPLTKHLSVSNPYVSYAADMTILLGYYDRLDDWQDERNFKSLAAAKALKRKAGRVKKVYPRQYRALKEYLMKLHDAESRKADISLDEIAGLTGTLLGEIFDIYQDHWSDSLRECGFYLGKFIYLLDAYEDLEEDRRSGSFNPLETYAQKDDFEKWFLQIMNMIMAGCVGAFERLPIIKDAELMRNILYSGVWVRYEKAVALRKDHKGEQ